jgi:dihydropyrimidinase/dihydroorotase
VAAFGGTAVAMVHAENTEIIEVLRARLRQEGRSDLAAMREARPGWVEAIDVYKVAVMAEKTGAPLFIVHTSAAESVDVIQEARLRGINIMAETTPAYLTHTADDPIGALGVEYPALKDDASKERLWEGIQSGIIEVIGTDYASIKKEEKQDIWTAKAGFGNLQVMLPALLSEGVGKGRISLEKAVEICCYKGALRFGLAGRKGKIDVGYDADIAIIDMDRSWSVTPEWLAYHYTDHTLYDGWNLTGWISKVYVRGKLVAQDGKTVGAPGWGKYLRREAN